MKSNSILNTLVIGGGGYIGAHLVPQLCAAGRRVTVLGRSITPRYELPSGVAYVTGDFGDFDLICRLLASHQEVIQLAYATVPNTSFENPLSDLLQNLPPSVQLFSEAAVRGVKLVLISSGGTVYGEADASPINEKHRTRPISPYGVTKLTLENYAYLYATTHGLKFVCVRPANAFGVGQRPFVGQGFISTAIASVLNGLPIHIYGQYGTIRDYLYVSDLASGIVSVLLKGKLSETYNLGSGVGLSNLDVIDVLKPLFCNDGFSVNIVNIPARSFDVKNNILDSKKLHKHTAWSPMLSFQTGLQITYKWLRSLKNENN